GKNMPGSAGLKRIWKILIGIFAVVGVLITALFLIPSGPGGQTLPLQLQYEMFADGLQFTFSGGSPDYSLTVAAGDEIRYGGDLEESGEFAISFEKFFAYPGDYVLRIEDGQGQVTEKTFTIPEPEDLAVSAFHTTSGMDTDNLWPRDQAQLFASGAPVYVFTNLFSGQEQPVTFKWYDEEANLLFAPEIHTVPEAIEDPFRIVTYQQIKNPGGYLIYLVNHNGIIVGETVFGVQADE
ncbi:MAG: hypothetical protein R3330_10095, partial [Saprospiraceae bacterium]|nr:hypothetical protein [Saprospiraceae bacterium]